MPNYPILLQLTSNLSAMSASGPGKQSHTTIRHLLTSDRYQTTLIPLLVEANLTEMKLVMVLVSTLQGSFIVIQHLKTNLSDIYGSRLLAPDRSLLQSLAPSQNEDGLSIPPPSQQLAIPNRDVRQPPSTAMELAYVIFGDHTTGIYYNWCGFSSLITPKLTLLPGMHVATS